MTDDNHEGLRGHEGQDQGNHEGLRRHDGHEAHGQDAGNHEGLRRHEGHDRGNHESGPERSKDPVGRESREGALDEVEGFWRMRATSALSPRAEEAMTRVIGCAMAVHKALGPGLLESVYAQAMWIEMQARGVSYEAERSIRVRYRGIDIPGQRVDLIVDGQIVVELKTVVRFDSIHVGQLLSYLHATGLRGGLLINFRVPLLKMGLKRIVL